ncbi:unnamed protein product [Toxocara canis]|uniref:Uncharacterized protein n=1 Tax=Toxocara canis TaxID=6265 RepID=A0A183VG68_TOXCA|nr:unnamed protein product [Toxocara canis]
MFSCIQHNDETSITESLSQSDSEEASPSPPILLRQKSTSSLRRLDAWIGYLLKEGYFARFIYVNTSLE